MTELSLFTAGFIWDLTFVILIAMTVGSYLGIKFMHRALRYFGHDIHQLMSKPKADD